MVRVWILVNGRKSHSGFGCFHLQKKKHFVFNVAYLIKSKRFSVFNGSYCKKLNIVYVYKKIILIGRFYLPWFSLRISHYRPPGLEDGPSSLNAGSSTEIGLQRIVVFNTHLSILHQSFVICIIPIQCFNLIHSSSSNNRTVCSFPANKASHRPLLCYIKDRNQTLLNLC